MSISGQSSESYSYDTDNRLSSLTRTIGTKNYATGYTYTTANQVTQLTYPSNRAVNLNHDSIGRLSSIVNNSDSANYLSSISYNPAGQTTGWTLGSNIAESLGYDSNRLQMTSQTVTQNGQTRLSLSYSYAASSGQMGGGSTAGNAGQLISVSGSIGGQTESAAYTYDNVGRLVTSNQTSNGVSAQRRFVYDRWGNRTEVYDATSGGSQIQSVSLEQSGGIPTNRITSVTESSTLNYTYDSAGNVTNDGVHSYTYDAENRVVSVDGGSTATYSYDHQNRRIKKVVGSTTTHYVWQGGQVIAEHNGSTGAVITEYIFAGNRMIAREGGGKVFFLYDRLSARATITDGQGNIQGRQAHLPFGEELNATGTTDKHRFTSYERDSETGTDYAVNRGYSANVGRFLSVDKKSGLGSRPQRLNRFAYTQNNPINRTDPLGLDDCPPQPCPQGTTWSSVMCDCVVTLHGEDDYPTDEGWEPSDGVQSILNIAWFMDPAESGYGNPVEEEEEGIRVPLSGDRLAQYTMERDRLVGLLRNKESDCAKFLLKQLGLSGTRVARAVLGQRAFDGTLSTIDAAKAGINPIFGGMSVKDLFAQLGPDASAYAAYASARYGSSILDVYYAPGALQAPVILHETLHYFLGIDDATLANRLGIDPSYRREHGSQVISWKLRDEGCR